MDLDALPLPPVADGAVERDALLTYLDGLLDPTLMTDYGPNGLQVEGRERVRRIVTGVTASKNLIDAAVAQDADAVLVHHGLFWEGMWPHRLTGWLGARVKALVRHDINLIAYHLPLDAHPVLGNNARILHGLGAPHDPETSPHQRFGAEDLGFKGELRDGPMTAAQVRDAATRLFGGPDANAGRGPLLIGDEGATVRTIGVVSGAGHRWIESAKQAGCDLFVTGEMNEAATHIARELRMPIVWAGHHATERLGVQAVGAHLHERLGLGVAFVDDPNPV